MTTPTVRPCAFTHKRDGSIIVSYPVPALSQSVRDHEREVYDADPTGGSASTY